METENEKKSGFDKRWLIAILALLITFAVTVVNGIGKTTTPQSVSSATWGNNVPALAYAEGVTALDEDSLQAAVEEMLAKASMPGFTTEYKNDAHSTDGQTFECYIGNSDLNAYDMYIQIFADEGATDQLFLSGLVRPGAAFRSITLDHPLDPGTHSVYVVYTQVEGEDLENMSIVGQVTITMDFVVAE